MKKSREAEAKIIEVLSDGEWHQAKALKVETHVSSKTLYRNLEKLKPYLEKHEDKESGKYPYPKYYRANKALMTIAAQVNRTDSMWKHIEERFLRTKDLAFALEEINATDNLNMIHALLQFKNVKPMPEIIEDLLYLFVWRGHEVLSKNLVISCLKDIDSINFEKAFENLVFTTEGKGVLVKEWKESGDIDTV